jgi:hypothetical protein
MKTFKELLNTPIEELYLVGGLPVFPVGKKEIIASYLEEEFERDRRFVYAMNLQGKRKLLYLGHSGYLEVEVDES